MKICLVTCLAQPALLPEDELLRAALEQRGCCVTVAPWNGPFDPFLEADLTLIRTPWDYLEYPEAFKEWLQRLERESGTVLNPPALMLWNMNKRYLQSLQAEGAPLPPTAIASPDTALVLAAAEQLKLKEMVLKPVISASSKGLSLVSVISEETVSQALHGLDQDVMIQPVLRDIETIGETSLVFFGDEFSHAVRKVPKSGDIRCQEEFGGSVERVEPPNWALKEAAEILRLLPENPTYARVDVIMRDQDLILMEVEVIEPELFFRLAPEAAQKFATAILA